jgi:regulatory protein
MVIISKIEQQKNNRERYNIYLAGENNENNFFAGVHQDIIIQHNLYKGLNIDQQDLQEVIIKDHIHKGFQKALKYLTARMKTCSEVATYLRRYEYDDDAIAMILAKLAKYRYVDDQLYAESYVKEHVNIGSKGPILIRINLQKKGVDIKTIEHALLPYTYELQLDNAMSFIQKKFSLRKRKSELDFKNTISQQLASHGFSYDIIETAISQYVNANSSDVSSAINYQGMKAHKKYAKLDSREYIIAMKKALYTKGFKEEDITSFLNSLNEIKKFDM